ncbi:hypothetical protein KCP77_00405 [Salmonella enterica subsp. enterica]|nr:hypothetical protein KCP77_00405 [Salmonella enterica subsp. enterica]
MSQSGLPDSPDYVCGRTIARVIRQHCIVEPAGSYPPLFNEGNFAAGRLLYIAQYAKVIRSLLPRLLSKKHGSSLVDVILAETAATSVPVL